MKTILKPNSHFLSALSGLGVMHSERIPHAKGAKGAKVENIRRPKLAGVFYLRALGGLGVRPSDQKSHAKGAKVAKGESTR